MRTVAYECKTRRVAAGTEFHPDLARMTYTNSLLATVNTNLEAQLSRGSIPFSATGNAVMHRYLSGRISGDTSGSGVTFGRDQQFLSIDGVAVDNGVTSAILRCGWNGNYIGTGRAAGGDFVRFDDDVQVAIAAMGTNPTIDLDGFCGPGQTIGNSGFGDIYNQNQAPLWSSHFGFCDFCEDEQVDTYHNTLFDKLKVGTSGNAASFRLPNQEVIKQCTFAGVCPTGTIYISNADYGGGGANGVPSNVINNTADAFRNHPSVFIRRKGAAVVSDVVRRWRDPRTIIVPNLGQPMGIALYSTTVTRSTWLMSIDGEATILFLLHPASTDYRRPKDIWNNVIVPYLITRESNISRIGVINSDEDEIGTSTNWQLLDWARFLGPAGFQAQTNAEPIG